jgi:uncharacterized protein (TIGR02328 family)
MRLWHMDLIPYLPRLQLLGQHRECCALRGNGWGRPHSTVKYAYNYPFCYLFEYHKKVMSEMRFRGYNPNELWEDPFYRGRNCLPLKQWEWKGIKSRSELYKEHDDMYLDNCVRNLLEKIHKADSAGKGAQYPDPERLRLYDGIRFFQETYRLDPKIRV